MISNKKCECCGAEFVANRRDARFCCGKCINKAYSEANREKIKAYKKAYYAANTGKA